MPHPYTKGQSNSEHTALESCLGTIWLPASSLLLAHCTSYAKSHFCRQKENWHQIIAFLILPVPRPAKTVLVLVPDVVRHSKQLISCVPQNWSDRAQMSASSEQIPQVQSPFPRLQTRSRSSASLQMLNSLTMCLTMPRQVWQKETWALQSHKHCLQGCRTWRIKCNGLIFPSSWLIKILSTLFRIQSSVIVQ